MLSRLELLIDLLHSVPDAALATHSTTLEGFPFASAVPFVTDEHYRPIFLISGLAEHSRNLAANPRASLMIAKATRYLSYHPHAERFLQLGDFRFHRFEPARVLTVGGFAKASWLEGSRLIEASVIPLADEADLLALYEPEASKDCQLRGGDAFGADATRDGKSLRIRFGAGPVTKEAWLPSLRRELATLTQKNLMREPAPSIASEDSR